MDSPCTSGQSVHVKILNTVSTTPMPNFDVMDDEQLKVELDRFGTRPMCRAKAIRMLKRIYEATHPVLSESTPLAQRVSHTLIRTQKRPSVAARADKTREKRTRAAISKFTGPGTSNSSVTALSATVCQGKESTSLSHSFLEWLRLPENEELYYELLTLNPVLFERLVAEFGEELRSQRISRTKFAEILDQLHVTYCVPQNE